MKVGQDAEFSLERFESRYRADLGNDLGNLVSRLLHMCGNYFDSVVPEQQLKDYLRQNSAKSGRRVKTFPNAFR